MRCCKPLALSFLFIIFAILANAQELETHSFDLSQVKIVDNSAPHIAHWKGTSPDGVTLEANLAYLTKNGKPLPTTVGEFHPQRYPDEYWEEAVLEMKAGGLNVIGSYWFWALIEPMPGIFDFTGSNNISKFLEICKKHNVLVFARIGPFNNGEMISGGLPPWIFGMPFTERSNEPAYLERVQNYYNEMGKQMQGMYWEDGGPVFMVQVENELSHAPIRYQMVYRHACAEENKGPDTEEGFIKHYETLREMALNAGINPVYFCMTGWRRLGTPENKFVIAFGGYMYLGKPSSNSGLTAIISTNLHNMRELQYPLAFIELGAAGSPARTNYFPKPPVESAMSTAISQIGAYKSIMCGWYMYHGGTNPLHPTWGFSAKYEDLALLSYDYHAPLSEFGVPRPAYYHLRPFHQTLLNFSEMFADGEVINDDPIVRPSEDKLRVGVRMKDDKAGVVFLLHYANIDPLSDRKAAIELKTKEGDIRIPSEGSMDLTNGDFAVLPFNRTWEMR